MTPDERRDLIARYRRAARGVAEAASSLSEEHLDLKQAGGGWTPRWVLHHVADTEVRAAARLHRLVAEDAPYIPAFDQGRTHGGCTTSGQPAAPWRSSQRWSTPTSTCSND